MANPTTTAPQIHNRPIQANDLPAVAALHARVFGPGRFTRTAYRIREGTPAISSFCRAAFQGDQLVASLRLTEVTIGGTGRHLLLGPLAVDPQFAGLGYGKALVSEALEAAGTARIDSVVLIGDLPYYDRFGFTRVPPGQIAFPGPVDPARILARALKDGIPPASGAIAPAL